MSSSIIKRAQVQLSGATQPASMPGSLIPAAPLPTRCKTRKTAVLVEAAGRPVAIEVTCSCGETTLVELEMPTQNTAAATEERKTT